MLIAQDDLPHQVCTPMTNHANSLPPAAVEMTTAAEVKAMEAKAMEAVAMEAKAMEACGSGGCTAAVPEPALTSA